MNCQSGMRAPLSLFLQLKAVGAKPKHAVMGCFDFSSRRRMFRLCPSALPWRGNVERLGEEYYRRLRRFYMCASVWSSAFQK